LLSTTSIVLNKAAQVVGLIGLLTLSCRPHQVAAPLIEFTQLPPAGEGSADTFHAVAGRVTGARRGQRIVLFARSGAWWVQPAAEHPYTTIRPDSTWSSSIHPGNAYAALLVDDSYQPPMTLNALPRNGGLVHAIAMADGSMLEHAPLAKLDFSGYEWLIRETPTGRSLNHYENSNVSVDEKGFLHLRVVNGPSGWTSAEVSLAQSLGYGSYRFVVNDVSRLEPSIVLTISAWDGSGPDREMDIEISRWGDPGGKNSQYVLQPYYLAANVLRFLSPAGRLTYSFDWEPGRLTVRTVRGTGSGGKTDLVAEHIFTSGVPLPGSESVRLNLYLFDKNVRHGAEVIIEKFEYLP
jgi:hypothetical protein